MSDLTKLLKDLGMDAELAEAYSKDPDSVLARYDLDDEALKALKSGDVEAVKAASGLSQVHMTHSTIKSY